MEVVVTVQELLDKGIWKGFCNLKDFDPYTLSEGLLLKSDEFRLTEEEARELGLLSGEVGCQG